MFQKLIESNKAKDTTDSSLIKLKWQEDEKIKTVGDIILAEFSGNKKLLEHGLGDSTSGSDDLPSEDNLPVEDLSKQLPETKTIKQCLKKALKDKAEAKKKEIEEEAIKKKEEIKAKRAEALKVKNEPPRPLPRKPYVRVPLVKDKKGEGIDMHTQTDRSYVSDMKAKLADQKAQIAERTRLSAQLQKE